ncbi:hypothetical protein T439DRAFT_311108 [Meredithblackwellia eburnea MCA 4105]
MAPSPTQLTLIVAATTSNGIGQSSKLPWRLSKEMAYFAKVTKHAPDGKTNAVIMGRKSWESIPTKFRPLSERVNIVVSRQKEYDLSQAPLTYLADSLPSAVALLSSTPSIPSIHHTFLIGGAELYTHSLTSPLYTPTSPTPAPFIATRVLLTRILSPAFPSCDVFIPDIPTLPGWEKASHEELEEFVGFEVQRGEQREIDLSDKERKREVVYEFQLWVRKH